MAESEIEDAGWSSARVDLLRMHHALGLSAAVSAQLIGGGVTRNAVISKRRRLNLVGANPLQAARWALTRTGSPFGRPADSRSHWFCNARPGPHHLRCEPLPFMDGPPPADADPKTLADRAPGECAWPLGPAESPGDWRTLFCCAPVERSQSYCAAHRARAFTDEAPRSLRLRIAKRECR